MDREFLQDLFSAFGPVSLRRMFSGYGVSVDGVNFALVLRGAIYFRTDEHNVARFADEGVRPFQYQARGKLVTINSYWQLPDRLYDDPEELADWARASLGAAERAAAVKRSRAARRAGKGAVKVAEGSTGEASAKPPRGRAKAAAAKGPSSRPKAPRKSASVAKEQAAAKGTAKGTAKARTGGAASARPRPAKAASPGSKGRTKVKTRTRTKTTGVKAGRGAASRGPKRRTASPKKTKR